MKIKNKYIGFFFLVAIFATTFFSSPDETSLTQVAPSMLIVDRTEKGLGDLGVQSAYACHSSCLVNACTWWVPGPSVQCPVPGPGGGCCLQYGMVCKPGCTPPPPPSTATPVPSTPTPIPDIPPSVSGSVSCARLGDSGWCLSDSSLDMTASDPQGYAVTIQGTIDGTPFYCAPGNVCSQNLPEGSGPVEFWARSSAGTSSHKNDTWKFDATAPFLSPDLPPVDGNNGWYLTGILANINASDSTSGIAMTGISVDGGTVQSPPVTLSEGEYILTFSVQDVAGNISTQNQSISIDTTNPSISTSLGGTLGSNGWYISSLDVSTLGTDALSGVESRTVSSGGAAVNGTLSLGEGRHTLTHRVTDLAGNSVSLIRLYDVDKSAPSLAPSFTPGTPDGANGWYTTSPVVTNFTSSDSVSGVESSGLYVNGGGLQVAPVNLLDGVNTIDFFAQNFAGLSMTTQHVVSVDRVFPSITPAVIGTRGLRGWYLSDAEIRMTSSDATSGIDFSGIEVDGSIASNPVTLSDGQYRVGYSARDRAGLLTQSFRDIWVDTISPTASFIESGNDGEGGWYVTDADISVLATDSLSGVDVQEYQLNGGAWQNGNALTLGEGVFLVRFHIIDTAGNDNYVERTIHVDKTSPSSSFTSHASGDTVSGVVSLSGKTTDLTSGHKSAGEISFDNGVSWEPISVNGAGGWTASWDAYALPNGSYSLLMRAEDKAGNPENPARVTLQVNNAPPSIDLKPSKWQIWEDGTLRVQENGIPIQSLILVFRDPDGNYPDKRIELRPRPTQEKISWDRRFGDGTIATWGEYEVMAYVCDLQGNCRRDISMINIPWYSLEPEITPSPTGTATSIMSATDTPISTKLAENTPIPDIKLAPTPAIPVQVEALPKRAMKLDLKKTSRWLVALSTFAGLALLTIDPRPSALNEIEVLGVQWVKISQRK
ncbi:MAG: hypothetical protein HN916_01005 [Anaerolineae bacterium]|nr:hypothetical protein [Anaerolineae bacterium]